jgi:DNA primase
MKPLYSKAFLRKIRNEIPINAVISHILQLPCKHSEGYFRFLCPLCNEFNTATKAQTNLARCFCCQKNFNPIDLYMAALDSSFKEAVEALSPWLDQNWRVI